MKYAPPPNRSLPPRKMEALELLGAGPLQRGTDGRWYPGRFNSHTAGWFVYVGWADYADEHTHIKLNADGRRWLAVLRPQDGTYQGE